MAMALGIEEPSTSALHNLGRFAYEQQGDIAVVASRSWAQISLKWMNTLYGRAYIHDELQQHRKMR